MRSNTWRAVLIFLAVAGSLPGWVGAGSPESPLSKRPEPPPARFLGLIGEYGQDQTTLIILEKEGQLHLSRNGRTPIPLTELGNDSFASPAQPKLPEARLNFGRDPEGRATNLLINAAELIPRKTLDGENGRTFRIKPVRSVEEIRRETEGMKPPVEIDRPRPADLIDLTAVVPGLKLEIRYATANNFLGVPLYSTGRALMQRPAAEALARVQAGLARLGYGLLIHDAYRPWRVTRLFWEATPASQHAFVADPVKGSKHNRGCAVDLTLCDLATGRSVEMVGGYDEFSDRSYPDYPGGTSFQRWHRGLLRQAMEAEGFTVNEAEWWHFDFKAWRDYPIIDIPFEALPPR